MINFIKKQKGFLVITSIFLISFLYMLPLRNQGYQDDWAYIQSVRNFHETGVLKISEWAGPSTVFLVYWGTLFSKVFGYSIKTLHLSVLVLFYVALISFYQLLKRLQVNDLKSIIFTVVFLSFPWVFHFSYTFITEVPYISLVIISFFFFIKGIQEKKGVFLVLGSILSAFAYLTRQTGLTIIFAIVATLLYQSYKDRKVNFKALLFSLIPFVFFYVLYNLWLTYPGNLTMGQYQINKALKDQRLPYLLPFDLGRTETTFGYQAVIIERVPFYFHHAIGFLLPIFLIFKVNFHNVLPALKKNIKIILGVTLIYLFFMAIEIIYHDARPTYRLDIPLLITRYSNIFPVDWRVTWKHFVIISVPIWLALISLSLPNIFFSIFKKRIKPAHRLFKLSILVWTISLVYFQIAVFHKAFKHLIPTHIKIGLLEKLDIYLSAIFSSSGERILSMSWLTIFLPTIFIIFAAYIFTHFKITNKKLKPEIMLIGLTFVFQSAIIIILGYYHWAQYTISFVPFFIIFLALISRKWKISLFRTIIVCALLLLFSIGLTKNRYQNQGLHWEIGEKLVQENKIEPIDISYTDEAWLAWWYFEKTFEEALENDFSQSKYNISPGQSAVWRTRAKSTSKYVYSIVKAPLNKKAEDFEFEVVLDTGPTYYSIFSKFRYIIYKEPK